MVSRDFFNDICSIIVGIREEKEVVSRDDLLNQVWGYDSFPYTRTIDAPIAMLRKKIEANPDKPEMIITIHGKGYKFL